MDKVTDKVADMVADTKYLFSSSWLTCETGYRVVTPYRRLQIMKYFRVG